MSRTQALRQTFESRITKAWALGRASTGNDSPHTEGSVVRSAFLDGRQGLTREAVIDRYVPKLMRWHNLGTRIGWCHFVWNWWTGCVPTSPGCKHCYAEELLDGRWNRGLWGRTKPRPVTKRWETRIRSFQKAASDPMWRREFGLQDGERPRVFVGSMMDWAEARDDLQRLSCEVAFEIVRDATDLDFLMLTKRPQNVAGLLPNDWGDGYDNAWLLTSVESGSPDVRDGELGAPVVDRIRILREVPAVLHGVSYEPALGPLSESLRPHLGPERGQISWVIYGGESGSRHRPEGTADDPKLWARDMRDACRQTGAWYFHKQSAHRYPGRGVELDGEIVHQVPFQSERCSHASS